MRNGFTIIQLAIVLVILGIIAGGALVSTSMIKATRIHAQVRQFAEFDTAVSNFRDKYNSIPGDSRVSTPAGDGSYTIWDYPWFETTSNLYSIWYFQGEVAGFWQHLSNSGYTQDGASFTSTITGTLTQSGNPRNIPYAAVDKDAGVMAGTTTGSGGFANAWMAVYQIGDYRTIVPGIAAGNEVQAKVVPKLTPAEAADIDAKMDDGLPRDGTVQASQPSTTFYYFAYLAAPTSACANAGATAYRLTNTSEVCLLSAEILSQSGGLSRRCRTGSTCTFGLN